MKDDVQLLVVGTQLFGVGMVAANVTVTAYRDDAGEVAQSHDLGTQLAGVLDRVFGCTHINDVVGYFINVGKYRVEDSDRVLFHNFSSTACSSLSMNSSTVCNRSLGVACTCWVPCCTFLFCKDFVLVLFKDARLSMFIVL